MIKKNERERERGRERKRKRVGEKEEKSWRERGKVFLEKERKKRGLKGERERVRGRISSFVH